MLDQREAQGARNDPPSAPQRDASAVPEPGQYLSRAREPAANGTTLPDLSATVTIDQGRAPSPDRPYLIAVTDGSVAPGQPSTARFLLLSEMARTA
jgi:hypothetical protein